MGNKGDIANPIMRSRLVGREFNVGKDDSLYASTPPLEAIRLLLSCTATEPRRECPSGGQAPAEPSTAVAPQGSSFLTSDPLLSPGIAEREATTHAGAVPQQFSPEALNPASTDVTMGLGSCEQEVKVEVNETEVPNQVKVKRVKYYVIVS